MRQAAERKRSYLHIHRVLTRELEAKSPQNPYFLSKTKMRVSIIAAVRLWFWQSRRLSGRRRFRRGMATSVQGIPDLDGNAEIMHMGHHFFLLATDADLVLDEGLARRRKREKRKATWGLLDSGNASPASKGPTLNEGHIIGAMPAGTKKGIPCQENRAPAMPNGNINKLCWVYGFGI